MPEETENFFRIPNPNYSGQAFTDTVRTRWLSERRGIKALWSPLQSSGVWKVRTLLFAKDKWPNMEACEAWVREHKASLKGLNEMQIKVKAVDLSASDGRKFGPTPNEDDLAIINDLALEPLQASEVYVRRMRLANDRIDRDWERFARGMLDGFKATLPGKSVLMGHDRTSEPIGRFYKAEVARDMDSGVVWLNGYWYMPVTPENEHDRKAIDSGVWSYASIGFTWDWAQCDLCGENYQSDKCLHILGQLYAPREAGKGREPADLAEADGQYRCTVTYRGNGEAREGSIVYLGAQYDAQVVKAKMMGDLAEEKRLLLEAAAKASGGDSGLAADVGEPEGTDGAHDGTTGLPDQASGTGIGNLDAEEAKSMSDELNAKLAETEAALKAAEERVTKAAQEAEGLAARCKALRDPVVDEVLTLGASLKRDRELATMQSMSGERFEALADEKLLELRDSWRKLFEENLPGRRQSTPSDEQPKGEGPGALLGRIM